MNEKALKELGLNPDQIKKVQDLHKGELDSNFVPKDKLAEQVEQIKQHKEQVKTLTEQVTKLKQHEGTNADLQKKIDEITATSAKQIFDMQADYNAKSKMNAVKAEWGGKVHNFDDFYSKLKQDTITLDDKGGVLGLKEQAEQVQKDYAYLFKSDTTPLPKGVTPANGNGNGSNGVTSSIDDQMSKVFGQ